MRIPRIFFAALLSSWLVVGCGGEFFELVTPRINKPPTSDAGSDQSVDEGFVVQLAAQGSDLEGTALSFLWSQVSGPDVALSSISDPAATFEAPEVPIGNSDPVVLSLRVTDGAGDSSTDEISVFVTSTDYGVFIANKDDADMDELYLYDAETDSISKLSGPLPLGGDVSKYSISPDGHWVAYLADEDVFSRDALYIAAVDGSGVNKVSGAPPRGWVGLKFVWSPDSSQIAFFRDAEQIRREDLFIVDPLGVILRKVDATDSSTSALLDQSDVSWSPDSRYLAQIEFSSIDFDVAGISVFDTQAVVPSNVRITADPQSGAIICASSYRWSPDSSRVAYVERPDPQGVCELFTVRPDGTDNRKVSGQVDPGGTSGGPVWSPDGSRIAFRSRSDPVSTLDMYTVRPDGTELTKINGAAIAEQFFTSMPFWAPDSSKIAYQSAPDAGGIFMLHTVRPNGSDNTVISNALVPDNLFIVSAIPLWSPDSSRILFVATEAGSNSREMYTVRPDGSDLLKANGSLVAGGEVIGLFPNWSPDASLIAYQADQTTDGVYETYTVKPDGTDNVKVNGPVVAGGGAGYPLWSRFGARIVYVAPQETDQVFEIFMSTPDGMSNKKISGPMVDGGDAEEFTWSP